MEMIRSAQEIALSTRCKKNAKKGDQNPKQRDKRAHLSRFCCFYFILFPFFYLSFSLSFSYIACPPLLPLISEECLPLVVVLCLPFREKNRERKKEREKRRKSRSRKAFFSRSGRACVAQRFVSREERVLSFVVLGGERLFTVGEKIKIALSSTDTILWCAHHHPNTS